MGVSADVLLTGLLLCSPVVVLFVVAVVVVVVIKDVSYVILILH